MSGAPFAQRKHVILTTRGRKSGVPRRVTIWFVADSERAISVQHTTAAAAQWFRNLSVDPNVTVDFGAGPIAALAQPVTDPLAVQEILTRIRRKYWTAWLIRLLARGASPVAARITWPSAAPAAGIGAGSASEGGGVERALGGGEGRAGGS